MSYIYIRIGLTNCNPLAHGGGYGGGERKRNKLVWKHDGCPRLHTYDDNEALPFFSHTSQFEPVKTHRKTKQRNNIKNLEHPFASRFSYLTPFALSWAISTSESVTNSLITYWSGWDRKSPLPKSHHRVANEMNFVGPFAILAPD